MNKDLISREALLKEVESRIMWSLSYNAICEAIQIAPAVDAVEVVHGRWIEHQNYCQGFYESTDYKCSVCGLERDWLGGVNYCPNCGSKMDLDGE